MVLGEIMVFGEIMMLGEIMVVVVDDEDDQDEMMK